MLYNNFIVCMMTCAFIALLRMIDNQDWEYIILPIGILIWGIFKFFDEDDREWLRRRGIDPDDFSWFFSDDFDDNGRYPINVNQTRGNTITWDRVEDGYNPSNSDHTRYMPNSSTYRTHVGWQNPAYKGIVKKCKRNFKITISDKKENDTRKKRESIFDTIGSFGCG